MEAPELHLFQAKQFAANYYATFSPHEATKALGFRGEQLLHFPAQFMMQQIVQDELKDYFYRMIQTSKYMPLAIIQQLMHLAFHDITDIVTVNRDGFVYVESTEDWSTASKQAVKSVQNRRDGISIICHDKLQALDRLAQIWNVYKIPSEFILDNGLSPTPVNIDIEDCSDPEIKALVQEYIDRANQ